MIKPRIEEIKKQEGFNDRWQQCKCRKEHRKVVSRRCFLPNNEPWRLIAPQYYGLFTDEQPYNGDEDSDTSSGDIPLIQDILFSHREGLFRPETSTPIFNNPFRLKIDTVFSDKKRIEKENPIPRYSEKEIIENWKKYLNGHYSELLKNHKDKYVAIVNDHVVDEDKDIGKLAERVYFEFGYKPIFMPFIGKEQIMDLT